MGTTYPWAEYGDALIGIFILFFILGLIFAYYRPSPPAPIPQVRYVPVYQPAPLPPPPPPIASPVVIQVQQAPAPAPKVMMKCSHCGFVFDMAAGRCTQCGAPVA